MAFVHIKNLLHKVIGVHVDSIGKSSIDRAITQRMQATNCNNSSTYYRLVKSDKKEFDELVEEIVVPETWFFRNITPFEVLRDNALTSRISKKTSSRKKINDPLKILSIPCSSGEEPYSIAMVLHDAGLKKGDFFIDAVDISKKALKKSRKAIYGKHSFREKGMGFQDKYFEPKKSGFQLVSHISDYVSFRFGNIITDKISPVDEYYDIIFCRNLLIYFDRKTQRKILNKLSSMLKCGGLLFVGHAESGQIDKKNFSGIRVEKSFSFRKEIKKNVVGSPFFDKLNNDQPVNKLKDIYNQLVNVTKKDIELSKKFNAQKYKLTENNDKEGVNIKFYQKIDALIKENCLSDAFLLCKKFLIKQPEDANTYYYLGLISHLKDNSLAAEKYLKKAIYLLPDHFSALSLLVILAEKRGDEDGAKSLRRREEKARRSDI